MYIFQLMTEIVKVINKIICYFKLKTLSTKPTNLLIVFYNTTTKIISRFKNTWNILFAICLASTQHLERYFFRFYMGYG